MRIVDYFIKNSFVVNLISAAICIIGLISVSMMPRDLHPPFEFNIVNVSVALPGASASEVETYLAYPIEDALEGMKGVEKITSQSRNGSLSLTVKYEAGFEDMDNASEVVRARILMVQGDLPEEVRDISVNRQTTTRVWLAAYLLSHFDPENLEHREALKKLKDKVESIPGIVYAESTEPTRSIYVDLIPEKLKEYEFSATDIRSRISIALRFAPVGRIVNDEEAFSVELRNQNTSIENIRNIPLRSNFSGQVVKLSDVAKVDYELSEKTTNWYYDKSPSTVLRVFKDTTSDSIDLSEKLSATLATYADQLPKPIEVKTLADGPHFIKTQLNVLFNNGIIGSAIVLIILTLLLNLKTSLWTFVGIPIAYLGTFILLYSLGLSVDLISMVGLLLVLGILVDDAIIVAEKYQDNLSEGMEPQKAAREAVRVLIKPVTGTVLTTVFAFSPLLILDSDLSTILFAVPIVVISCLVLSWIESFFILPNHLSHFVKEPPRDRAEKFMDRARSLYKRVIHAVMPFRYVALGIVAMLFAASGYIAVKDLQHNFRLSIGMQSVTVYAFLKDSPSLDATYEEIKPLENDFYKMFSKDEIDGVSVRVGSAWHDGRKKNGYRFARLRIYANKMDSHPSVLNKMIKEKVSDYLKTYPEKDKFEFLSAKVTKRGQDEEKKGMVTVVASGRDEYSFEVLEKAIWDAVEKQEGIERYARDLDTFQMTWEFDAKSSVLAEYSLSHWDVARQIRGHFVKDEVREIRIAGDNVKIYTRVKRGEDPKFNELSGFKVITPVGTEVALSQLGDWKQRWSLSKVKHKDGLRNFRMDFEFDQKEVNEVEAKKQVRAALAGVTDKFSAYNITVDSSNEDDAGNMAWAMKVAVVCIGLVMLTMALVLGSITQPFLVGLPIPFGIMGIIFALKIHDMELGVMALIGLIGTVGVAVNDSLIMIDQINILGKKRGGLSRDVIVDGAASRLRAIILTTVTTLGGVFPMAYSLGGEAGFTQPLAFSMGWGLAFATTLTLFVLPTVMVVLMDLRTPVQSTRYFFGLVKGFYCRLRGLPVPQSASCPAPGIPSRVPKSPPPLTEKPPRNDDSPGMFH